MKTARWRTSGLSDHLAKLQFSLFEFLYLCFGVPLMSDMLKLAKSLAKKGLHVFPCRPSSVFSDDAITELVKIKSPWVRESWSKESTTDLTTIKDIWTDGKSDAMPGIDLGKSGHVVIDLDRHNDNDDGVANFTKLATEHNCHIAQWPTVVTPSGGKHVYFLQPKHITLGNGEGKLPRGINVRGKGGYVIAPGAEGDAGAYSGFSRPITEAVELPQWLIDIIKPPRPSFHNIFTPGKASTREYAYASAALRKQSDEVAGTREGSRNNVLYKAAAAMGNQIASGRISEHEVVSALTNAGLSAGLDPEEVNNTIESGLKKGTSSPAPDLRNSSTYAQRDISLTPNSDGNEATLDSSDDGESHDNASEDDDSTGFKPVVSSEAAEKPEDVEKKREAIRKRREAVERRIDELNRDYCIVRNTSKTLVAIKEKDERLDRYQWVFMPRTEFKAMYENEKVYIKGDDGKLGSIELGVYWTKHPRRREYLDGVTLDPTKPVIDENEPVEKKTAGVKKKLNLWTGFGVKPIKNKNGWSYLQRHIRHNICDNNEEYYTYILCWLSNCVQNPASPGQVALVLRGEEGSGKGTVANTMLKLFGQHGLYVSSGKHLTGEFNAHLRDCIFLYADEAHFAGDKKAEAKLKSLITEKYVTLEAKHVDAKTIANMLHILMTSNNDWVIPAGPKSRRYAVFDVTDRHAQDIEYFDAIYMQLEDGGYEAMLYDLLHMDLTGWDIWKVPQTKALLDQKMRSADSKTSWLFEVVDRGYVYKSQYRIKELEAWTDWVSLDLLYDSYLAFCKDHNDRYPEKRESLGSFLSNKIKLIKPTSPRGHALIGEVRDNLGGHPHYSTIRKHGYILGTRKELKAKLKDYMTNPGSKRAVEGSNPRVSIKKLRWGASQQRPNKAPNGAAHEPDENLEWILVDPAEAAATSSDN
jgi:hypothetical protein